MIRLQAVDLAGDLLGDRWEVGNRLRFGRLLGTFDRRLEAGDILLLLTPSETKDDVIDWLGCLPLADRGLAVTDNSKTWLAIGLFASSLTENQIVAFILSILACRGIA